MRKYLLQLMGLALVSVILYSCKLDKPILPGDPNYVAVTPPGGGTDGGTTTIIDNASLTGKWVVDKTIGIIYFNGSSITGGANTFFTAAEIDDAAKTTTYVGQFSFPSSDEVSYTLLTSNNKVYFQFSGDVFQRSVNGPVQITSLTSTAMTWLAPDPMVVMIGGKPATSAIQVTFTKE